jgi:hypothetical protein
MVDKKDNRLRLETPPQLSSTEIAKKPGIWQRYEGGLERWFVR